MKDYYENPGLLLPEEDIAGRIGWRSPSNIALVKYWGKYGRQLPKNASLSMTLSKAYTETSLKYRTATAAPKRVFLFEGNDHPAFAKRIWKFVDSLEHIFPYLQQMDLEIDTKNSFPHSAGIASSASAMSALALCLVDMERQIFHLEYSDAEFFKKASYIARLGSGSASRSIYPGFSLWGHAKKVSIDSDNKFAIPFYDAIHPSFRGLRDAILIVDDAQKKVSSSMGHSLMNHHPYADDRLAQADRNLNLLDKALRVGDKQVFINVVESEALSLHALMMTSDPWFMLMKAESMSIIQKIKKYREHSGKFITFTMDAGPNVHVLYSEEDQLDIHSFIDKELKPLCVKQQLLYDEMGKGPIKLK